MFQSMILFHRRILILVVIGLAILIVLVFQLGRLTLEQGKAKFEKAQGRLHATTFLPTWRGRIIDRKGRVIAEDVASKAISVDWDVITGDRAIKFARKDARTSIGNERWQSISPDERDVYIQAYLPARLSELSEFWRVVAATGNVDIEEVNRTLSMIREEVGHTAQAVWVIQEQTHRKRFGDSVEFDPQPIREQRVPHVVLPQVSDEIAMAFELLRQQFDNVIHVEHSRQRNYPNRSQRIVVDRSTLPQPMRKYDAIEVSIQNVAKLIVGDVRNDVWEEELDKKPFRSNNGIDLAGYRAGDEVGKRGLEQSLEDSLRGTRGQVVKHRNGEELSRTSVVGGEDVQVTLDIKLQARVEAALSPELGLMQVQDWHNNDLPTGTPLRGAVVILDIETSEVLAMASTPAKVATVDGYLWFNRAAKGLYPPGSIIKPLVLAAAITDDELQPDESIECVGHYFEHVTNYARCWIYRDIYNKRTHGHLKPIDAIARSCNIFFYELGIRLGFETLIEWLQKFGMSQPVAAQLTSTNAVGSQGHVPDQADIESLRSRGEIKFATVSIAIGQGALTWSPLHAAAAYATLARGGVWMPPSLVIGLKHDATDLQLQQEGVALALRGLQDSVSKRYGTGATIRYGGSNDEPTFNIDRVRLWGKTGTAQAPPYLLNNEPLDDLDLDHSWFLVMASALDEAVPRFVVAVLVEHGGSGGRVAGPIANQILHALQIEGYLESIR